MTKKLKQKHKPKTQTQIEQRRKFRFWLLMILNATTIVFPIFIILIAWNSPAALGLIAIIPLLYAGIFVLIADFVIAVRYAIRNRQDDMIRYVAIPSLILIAAITIPGATFLVHTSIQSGQNYRAMSEMGSSQKAITLEEATDLMSRCTISTIDYDTPASGHDNSADRSPSGLVLTLINKSPDSISATSAAADVLVAEAKRFQPVCAAKPTIIIDNVRQPKNLQ